MGLSRAVCRRESKSVSGSEDGIVRRTWLICASNLSRQPRGWIGEEISVAVGGVKGVGFGRWGFWEGDGGVETEGGGEKGVGNDVRWIGVVKREEGRGKGVEEGGR
jgi:hypothetical protein